MAEHDGRKVFVPLALPGETVTAELDGDRARVSSKSSSPAPGRIGPRCCHYGECGGCSLQHMPEADYLEFKRRQVVSALSFQRIDVAVDPVIAHRAAHAPARGVCGGAYGQDDRRRLSRPAQPSHRSDQRLRSRDAGPAGAAAEAGAARRDRSAAEGCADGDRHRDSDRLRCRADRRRERISGG